MPIRLSLDFTPLFALLRVTLRDGIPPNMKQNRCFCLGIYSIRLSNVSSDGTVIPATTRYTIPYRELNLHVLILYHVQ
jgi:hypothetical protein